MLVSAWHAIAKSFQLSTNYMGTTAFAIGVGLFLFLFREIRAIWQEGWGAVKRRWMGDVGCAALLTAFVWASLFMWCVARTVYNDHTYLVGEVKRLNRDKEKAVDDAQREIGKLTEKLNLKPREIIKTHTITVPGSNVDEAELNRLRTELNDRKERAEQEKKLRELVAHLTEMYEQCYAAPYSSFGATQELPTFD